MLAPAAAGSFSYDLCLNVPGRRPFWRNRNRGITLNPDTIAWTMDGVANETAYGNIVAVHLDSSGQKVTTDRCTLTFSDGTGLTVVNTNPGGYRDADHAVSYRAFVRDLHGRLTPDRYGGIRFTAGVPLWRYRLMLAVAGGGAPAFALVGLTYFLVFHLVQGLVLIAAGEFVCWKLYRRARANAPRDYAPDRLPVALLE